MNIKKIASQIVKSQNTQRAFSSITESFSGLLTNIAKYVLTNEISENPPKILTAISFSKNTELVDIQVDVNETMPVINNMTAVYDDCIITAFQDYSQFKLTCYHKTRELALEWIKRFYIKMRTKNQYRGKCLYTVDGGLEFHEVPNMNWNDVILLDGVKQDIKLNTISFLGDERLAKAGVLKRGIMMYGPPGTGKTSVVKAIFNELNGKNVSRIYVTAESFRNTSVKDLFDLIAYLGPTVLAFEDIDFVGTDRKMLVGSSNMLGDLLTNIDGMRKYNDPIVIIASTNDINMLDGALSTRPGRFDRKIEIGLPNQFELNKLYEKFYGMQVPDIVIKMSNGFTGSHVVETINTAKILSASEGLSKDQSIIQACKIIRDNFFPGQTTSEIKTAAKIKLMKIAKSKRNYEK